MTQIWRKIIASLCLTSTIPLCIYLYQHNLDYTTNLMDPLFATSQLIIHFLKTDFNETKLKLRTLCSIESASKHNPNSLIVFHTLSPLTSDSVQRFPNVKIRLAIAEDILNDTPLIKWYRNGEYKNGPYEETHLSDALRLALLWKYGGVYMDTDIWSVKSVSNLSNSIARESDNYLNGAVMIFDKGHPFMFDCMKEYSENYEKFEFTAQGPDLLTRVLSKKCGIKGRIVDANLKEVFACYNIHLLPPKTFFPVPYTHWKFYFMPVSKIYTWKKAYTFHLWNKVSGKFIAKPGNKLFAEEVAQRNCPFSYKLMEQKGEI